jgi:hypothetical protein
MIQALLSQTRSSQSHLNRRAVAIFFHVVCVRYDLFARQGFNRKDPTGAVTTGSCRHRSDAAAPVAGSWSSTTLPSSEHDGTYRLSIEPARAGIIVGAASSSWSPPPPEYSASITGLGHARRARSLLGLRRRKTAQCQSMPPLPCRNSLASIRPRPFLLPCRLRFLAFRYTTYVKLLNLENGNTPGTLLETAPSHLIFLLCTRAGLQLSSVQTSFTRRVRAPPVPWLEPREFEDVNIRTGRSGCRVSVRQGIH